MSRSDWRILQYSARCSRIRFIGILPRARIPFDSPIFDMKTFKKTAVIGAGAWGTALSIILSKNFGEVSVWAREGEIVDSVAASRENSVFLPGVKIPENVEFSGDARRVLQGAQMVVWVVPIKYLSSAAGAFAPHVEEGAIMVNAGKGIEVGTWRRPSEILEAAVKQASSVGSIMGPNIAYEVAQDRYAEDIVALTSHSDSVLAARAFSTPSFIVRPSDDVVGVEIGAALKNIVALAAGFCDGMDLGANTKAIVMARGFQEIYRAAASLGAWSDSFVKESAILGDVLTTCISPDSRNRTTGEHLGRGLSVPEALKLLKGRVCAGLETIQICRMFEKLNVKLPIMTALCDLSEGKINRQECLARILGAREAAADA